MRHVGKLSSGGEVPEKLKAPNVLKEKNHDFNRAVDIDLKSIYAEFTYIFRYISDTSSDTFSSSPELCTDPSSSQNSSRHRNVSASL